MKSTKIHDWILAEGLNFQLSKHTTIDYALCILPCETMQDTPFPFRRAFW